MKRTIQENTRSELVEIAPPDREKVGLVDWLTLQATSHQLRWLLAHADDGVVWGEIRQNQLTLYYPPALRYDTLWHLRLFGDPGELFLFQGPVGWCARLRRDGSGSVIPSLDEEQRLWGNHGTFVGEGWLQVQEGRQGISHILPMRSVPDDRLRARLRVRHYLTEAPTGQLYISDSRLVSLVEPKGESQ